MPPIITLTTDFGTKDPYVAQLKAAILTICPNTTIVDITHEIEKFNIKNGAYILSYATPCFPNGTIHVGVVDPGVGTQRRPIIIQTKKAFFVGPDNGLLLLAAKPPEITCVHEISNPKLALPVVSSTFHGRDIFAPAAAHVANGVNIDAFGPKIDADKLVTPTQTTTPPTEGQIEGEVLHVDSFGNIITSINPANLKNLKTDQFTIDLPKMQLKLELSSTYAKTKPQQPLLIVGSHGNIELALNQGNAAAKLQIHVGDKIVIS